MELPDAALKIGAHGKWQHFQKDFFYRLVRHEKKMEKHNTYGVLITVVSLLFIIIYSSEAYDQWDLLISILAAYFGISYLKSGQYFGWFSGFLGGVISVVGVLVSIISFSSIIQPPVSKLEVFFETGVFYNFSWLFLITIGLSLVISILMKIKNAYLDRTPHH